MENEKKQDEIKKLLLLQTNQMTFGQFSITAWQDNILTLINEQLQNYMTGTGEEISKDLFGEPYVAIKCDDAGGKNNKAKVIKEAKDLMKKTFTFRWKGKNGRITESSGVIITTVHNDVGSNNIFLTINKWAIPFLVYYGEGSGGTWYNKQIALNLRGDKTKRIYKMICSWHDFVNVSVPIDKFREELELGASYTNTTMKRQILEPAKRRIKESESPIWFDYELKTEHNKNNGRKPAADTILFKIKNLNADSGPQKERNDYIARWVYMASNNDPNAGWYIPEILASDKMEILYNRITYWEDQVASGNLTTPHMLNKLRKMLKDDFGVDFTNKGKKK